MLVEMYKKDGYWCFNDATGIRWATNLIVGELIPKEVVNTKEIKYKRSISNNLEDIHNTLGDILDILNVNKNTTLNIEEVTRLVAVSQDAKNYNAK